MSETKLGPPPPTPEEIRGEMELWASAVAKAITTTLYKGVHGEKWDRRFLDLADKVAEWSKDPRTKIGAVIVRPDKTVASVGFNGFPRGVLDTEERLNDRDTKLKFVVHGESNAVLSAREPLHGYTLYTQGCPCNECAKDIIQSGISTVVVTKEWHKTHEKWLEAREITLQMFKEAGVEFIEI